MMSLIPKPFHHTRILHYLLLLLLMVLAGAGCGPREVEEQVPPDSLAGLERCGDLVDAFATLREDREFPEHFLAPDAVKNGTELKVSDYFTIFDRLSMTPGYTLDYVYYQDSWGGGPILYVRAVDDAPFASYSEFDAALGSLTQAQAMDRIFRHVQVDGSDEGYLQLALLHFLGDQFYLYWHANYNDAQIVCNQRAVETLLTTNVWYGSEERALADLMTTNQVKRMRSANIAPRVTFRAETVVVQAAFFTHWGGLFKGVWEIERSAPYYIEFTSETLVDYDSGVMF